MGPSLHVWLPGLLALAVLASGCGPGNSDEERGTKVLTTTDYRERTNKVCNDLGPEWLLAFEASGEAWLSFSPQEFPDEPSRDAFLARLKRAHSLNDSFISALEAVSPPATGVFPAERFFKAADRWQDAAEDLTAAYESAFTTLEAGRGIPRFRPQLKPILQTYGDNATLDKYFRAAPFGRRCIAVYIDAFNRLG